MGVADPSETKKKLISGGDTLASDLEQTGTAALACGIFLPLQDVGICPHNVGICPHKLLFKKTSYGKIYKLKKMPQHRGRAAKAQDHQRGKDDRYYTYIHTFGSFRHFGHTGGHGRVKQQKAQ